MIKLEIFAGAALGLLLGMFLGMSVSPVAATMVAALVAGLFGWGTLVERSPAADADDLRRRIAIRLGTFAIACTAAALLGMYLRTHDLLAPSLSERAGRWEALGLSPDEARAVLVQQETGLDEEGLKHLGSVFFAHSRPSRPRRLSPAAYARAVDCLPYWKAEGDSWAQLGAAIDALPEDQRERVVRAIWNVLESDQ